MISIIRSYIIAKLCYGIDKKCRQELYNGHIISERDYVSNLGTHLRFPFGHLISFNLAIAQTLPPQQETTFGCDSIIIFKKRNTVKIGIFEAKWPRYFTNFGYSWDSKQANLESRFSSQIRRQNLWINSGLAIWEMFFNESAPRTINRPFDEFGSSCVLHQDAYKYLLNHKQPLTVLWNNKDLNGLISDSINFHKLVYNILNCRYGKLFVIEDYKVTLLNSENKAIQVPIARAADDRNGSETILSFMEECGLLNFIQLEII